MKEQFNLSKERNFCDCSGPNYPEDKVKEFIRLLKDETANINFGEGYSYTKLIAIINKLAGDKLK